MHHGDEHTETDLDLATGAFEPCHEFRAAHHEEPCSGCGWLAADHESEALAVVIAVPRRSPRPLRRAS